MNSINAAWGKGLPEYIDSESPDVIAIQETKVNPGDESKWTSARAHTARTAHSNMQWHAAHAWRDFSLTFTEKFLQYNCHFYCCSSSKGYSGVAVFIRKDSALQPLNIATGLGDATFDSEGRLMTVHFADFVLVNTYVPNSGLVKFDRLEFRKQWDKLLRNHLVELAKQKPVIWCGDLNVAHHEIDVSKPESRRNKVPGFHDDERKGFSEILESGFVDIYRLLHPKVQQFTFWGYKFDVCLHTLSHAHIDIRLHSLFVR